MRIAIFGGSFNPPHIGHISAIEAGLRQLEPDTLLVIPAGEPPHKTLPPGSPSAGERLELAELAFSGIPHTVVSDIEQRRGGVSYTARTVSQLRQQYPQAELFLLIGLDMLKTFNGWVDFRQLIDETALAVFTREDGTDDELFAYGKQLEECSGARLVYIKKTPIVVSSTQLREMLKNRQGRDMLPDAVYAQIIKKRYYNAKPELQWLRDMAVTCLDERRIPHVLGCESEAVRLAERWGADPYDAAEAAILHDITKKLSDNEQLKLCEIYDIIPANAEIRSPKILHSATGAQYARAEFGVSDEVFYAIHRHTTGSANMSVLDKIIYLADYIEPNRDFEGLDELRQLAYTDLNRAMELGLRMSIDELKSRGMPIHQSTIEAMRSFYQ